jgi:hypothetical protein
MRRVVGRTAVSTKTAAMEMRTIDPKLMTVPSLCNLRAAVKRARVEYAS